MPEPEDTVYDADPHTQAKHQILREYLKRWLPILARQSEIIGRPGGRLLYVDGFAGAGEYTDSIPGSPLVAIETVLTHSRNFPVPVQIKLIESRPDRVQHLQRLVAARRHELESSRRVVIDDPIEGDCEQVINSIIDACERDNRRLGPALFFLDQCGYSSFSMGLIRHILKHEVCEVFSYLNWNLLHPFMTDQTKHAGITKAFGGDEWMPVVGLSGKAKEERFRDIYLDALHDRAGARYAYPFAMRDRNNCLIYWLFFCTNNLRGLEEMKRAMWTVDRSGGFEFSDKFASQLGPLFTYGVADLARDLVKELHGQTMTVAEVEEYVLVNTPACNYRRTLGKLERDGQLEVVDPPIARRKGAFKDKGMKLRFVRPTNSDKRPLFDL
jgi:three-Cys-motif partner protein